MILSNKPDVILFSYDSAQTYTVGFWFCKYGINFCNTHPTNGPCIAKQVSESAICIADSLYLSPDLNSVSKDINLLFLKLSMKNSIASAGLLVTIVSYRTIELYTRYGT
jgi:hypothetical protein